MYYNNWHGYYYFNHIIKTWLVYRSFLVHKLENKSQMLKLTLGQVKLLAGHLLFYKVSN